MEISGNRILPVSQATLWAALNDEAVLARAIPGCESLTRLSATELEGRVKAKVGPVRATFTGQVTLSEIDEPNGYTISGKGQGGAAGFAKGSARITLSDAPDGTRLDYVVTASVGGKLAQIGSRLVDGTVKKLAGQFFDALEAELAPASEDQADDVTEPLTGEAGPIDQAAASETKGLSEIIWVAALIGLVLLSLWLWAG